MKNHELVVRIRDDERLAELEKVIAKGQKTFIEVGLSLAEIRDTKLYRREYSGFEEYCRKKWGWSRQHAYRLIEAAPIGKCHHVVTDEATARVLAGVEPSEREGLIGAVVGAGKAVTAAELKRNLPPPPMQRRATGGAPGAEPGPGKVSPRGDTFESGKCEANGPEATPPPPGQVVDGTGWPIPTQLIPLWQRADEVQELLTVLSRVKGALRSAQENRDMLFAEVNFSSALSQLDQAWTDVKTAKPFAVCPTCQGQIPDKCTLCRGRGLISEYRWNTCVTREHKEFRTKAKTLKR